MHGRWPMQGLYVPPQRPVVVLPGCGSDRWQAGQRFPSPAPMLDVGQYIGLGPVALEAYSPDPMILAYPATGRLAATMLRLLMRDITMSWA